MLKITKFKPELILDTGMYILFENGAKDGISYISNRYSKAKNKYLKSYDHVIYLDANNVYGYAMSFLQQVHSNG